MNIAVLADSNNGSKEAKAIKDALKKGDHSVEIYDVDQQIMATLKAKRPDCAALLQAPKVIQGRCRKCSNCCKFLFWDQDLSLAALAPTRK